MKGSAMTAKQTRREFLAKAATAAAAGVAGAGCRTALDGEPRGVGMRRRPNIVFLFADDMGYGDLGCYGCPDARTPVVDRLAREGVRFTEYYAAAPECTPTRTALMTGRYLHRVGGLECAIGIANVGRYDDAIRLAARHDLGLPAAETSIARMLKDAGYATAVYGKWHLGYEQKFLPPRHGFDHFVGILGGNCDYFHHCEPAGNRTLYENDRPIERDEYMTDLITNESVAFLRRQVGRSGPQRRPFFLYVSYTAPHSPYQGPNDRRPTKVPQDQWNRGTRSKYVEMVEYMDAGIGRILDALVAGGFDGETLVIFASDNGANPKGRNAPFAGHKSGLYEGGIRVPCIARWPGVLPRGRVSHQPAITMDLSLSMVRAAGAGPPKDRPFDGIDLLGEAAAGRAAHPRTLFWRARRGERTWRAVRDGSMKYLSRHDGDKQAEWLFDLAADPGEKHDLLARRGDETSRLKGLLAEWEREVRHSR
jgi:arylsulfatase A-like enzyme